MWCKGRITERRHVMGCVESMLHQSKHTPHEERLWIILAWENVTCVLHKMNLFTRLISPAPRSNLFEIHWDCRPFQPVHMPTSVLTEHLAPARHFSACNSLQQQAGCASRAANTRLQHWVIFRSLILHVTCTNSRNTCCIISMYLYLHHDYHFECAPCINHTSQVKINVLETAVQPGHVHFKCVFTPEPITEVFF